MQPWSGLAPFSPSLVKDQGWDGLNKCGFNYVDLVEEKTKDSFFNILSKIIFWIRNIRKCYEINTGLFYPWLFCSTPRLAVSILGVFTPRIERASLAK